MNVIPFSAGGCDEVRRHLDSYLSGELLVETNKEVLHHLEGCRACTAIHEEGLAMRGALRQAVRSELPPPELAARIRIRIDEQQRYSFWNGHWRMMAVAAVLLMAVATAGLLRWSAAREVPLSAMTASEQDSVIETALARVVHFARGGLGDHLHCTIARKYPAGFPAESELKPRQKLEADWEPLRAIAAKLIPSRYALLLAHRCSAQERRFVHLTYVDSSKRLLSVIVSPKREAERLDVPGIVPSLERAGIALYGERSGRYSISAFQSGAYMAWVVSDLPAEENQLIAANLAPAVSKFLAVPRSEI
jgi:hypothetical protein